MALSEYKKKRSESKTPEPFGGKPQAGKLQFVIQKHAASHLHYDFRLEVRGVLKSWAVPKGPSMDPAIKHLAMLVEDHPFDYKDFEGIIPKGQYGGGTVIVWDQGTYEPLEKAKSKSEQEKIMIKEFYAGSIKIRMHGKKLKGEFALVKTAGRGDNAWLLIKHKDEFATTTDITLKDKSVISKLTIDQMAGNKKARLWISDHAEAANTSSHNIKPEKTVSNPSLKKGTKTSMPAAISPMLCTLTKEPVNEPEYLYELKWDGYRILSYVNKGKTRMDSRSSIDYTKRYPRIGEALKKLKHDVVLDGEVVVFNDEGLPDFDALQLYNGHDTPISYCVFDLLWLDGYSVMDLPLTERKELLQELLGDNDILRFSESFDDGAELYKQAVDRNLEGIVAKKKDSPYVPGERGNAWLKTPTRKRQEFVIGGWAESDRNRSFRSLMFGAYRGNKLEWIGRSGGGYKEKEMPSILKELKAIEIDESPFSNKVLDTKGAKMHWVKPQLVANFEFAAWTKSGRIRKPATFLGFRKDKKPTQVVREIPKSVDVVEKEVNEEKHPETSPASKKKTSAGNWPKIERAKSDEQEFEIDGCTITLNDVDRVIWKDMTKADLITYYHQVSGYMLPHLKDRPQSLLVKPDNVHAPGFYIKDMEGHQPKCADIFTDERRHKEKGKRDNIDYLVCNNESTLLWMINLGCIDINPWNSRIQSPDKPDYITIDLDPSDNDQTNIDLNKLLVTAMATKEYLDSMKIKAFCKTSGKTGIHFFIPCHAINNTEARSIAETICGSIHELVPNDSTVINSINSRQGKVYIDPSQNDYADTLASCYSVRPYHIPTISTPLEWKEINFDLRPGKFTMEEIIKRLSKKGDVFKGVLDKKIAVQNTNRIKQKI